MQISEQPGRYAAIFVIAPFLVYAGICVRKTHAEIATMLIILAVLFVVYELVWVILWPAKKVELKSYRESDKRGSRVEQNFHIASV